jgi:hypothetical protein
LAVIGGAAAAVVVAIVAAIVLASPDSHRNTSAAIRSAPTQPGPAAPAPAGPAPAQAMPLDSVLLGAPEISTIMGVPSMDIGSQTQQTALEWQLSNPNCNGAFYPTQNAAYATSGFTGMRGELLHSGSEYRVYEAAVSFPTADAANAFVVASVDKWKACAGSTVTVTATGGTAQWNFGELTGTPPKITLPRTRKDGANQCQHVLSAVRSVVLDVVACAPGTQNQASQIADQMANNVKQ